MTSAGAACTVCELHTESTFMVEGMDCREEVSMIERRFHHLKGIERFSVDILNRRLHVTYDAARLSTSAIVAAVADAGMRAWLEHEEPISGDKSRERRRRMLLAISAGALGAGLITELAGWSLAASRALFAVSIAAGASLTLKKAQNSLRLGSADINVLMLVAAAGAVVLGQWSEAAAVVFLFGVAQALEALTLERARLAVRALIDLTPAEALVREGATERTVAADLVPVGSIIVIRPGEKVPLDGEVVAGISTMNQAPVTGESMPIDKAPGDTVFAGSINGRGALDMRVTHMRRDTTLARITHMVERAQSERAPAQTFIEQFARVYTPVVIALAAATALIGPLIAGGDWHTWTYRGLVLLVVSCPCALVISTPVSVVAALAAAARKGVLIKGGVHLERASRLRCIAFDKTGTLTRGRPEVLDVETLDGLRPHDVLALAASVERRSDHPIAHAILQYAAEANIRVSPGIDVAALDGRGAEGYVDGAQVVLGNHRLFEERHLCSSALHDRLSALEGSGTTSVLVARDGVAVGIISIADRPRDAGREAIQLLRQHGIESVVMLTGDSAQAAQAIASSIGVDDVRADFLPEDKVVVVAELKRRYGSVAMVGDGVNDAPALATADVGIAMGAAGSDMALETADVALMADELLKIPYALRLSRRTMRNIKVNLAISFALKAAFVVAAVAGVATLWMAVLADTGASVLVVANALRLLRAD